MPCPSSPEPDHYHRYVLPSTGKTLAATCVYCGQPRTYRPDTPSAAVARHAASLAKGLAGSTAAKRAKREAAE